MNIRRGGVYVASLDPVLGREISKTRPVVVVSNDKNNEFSGTVTILPLTSQNLERIYPFEVLLPRGMANLPKDSKAKADQIRSIDKTRIVKYVGNLGKAEMKNIDDAMKIHLELT
jgi:mRNA interferase MazF